MSKEMRLAFVSRYVPTSVRVYGEMKDSMEVHELGGTFPLDEYGTVLVSGHDDYGHNLRRTHTTRGAPLRNVNPR
jgi:non-heme Fe2+,alpha-ketoglutarate-dependent halogenase